MKSDTKKIISFLFIMVLAVQTIICAENMKMANCEYFDATDATDIYNDSDCKEEVSSESIKVDFDANGGVNAPDAIFSNDDGYIEIPLFEPSNSTFIFAGWATEPKATQAEYMPGDCFECYEDTILYALWLDCKISKKSTERKLIIKSNLFIPELTVWVAAYYEDSMVAIKYLQIQLNVGENIIETKVDWSDTEKDEIKVFPWGENLKPYADSQEVGIAKKYTVTFTDWDGTILNEQFVFAGEDATVPKNPERGGYKFLCWDGVYKNIFCDSRVIATYERIIEDVESEKNFWYTGKRVSYLGDSLTANGSGGQFRTYVNNYFDFSSETVSAFGGTLISGQKNNMGAPFWYDSRVNSVDLDSDVIFIFGGTNDANNNIPLGEYNVANSDTSTFYGAYNVLISKLMYKFYGNIENGYYEDIDYSGVTRNKANEIDEIGSYEGFVQITGEIESNYGMVCKEFSVVADNTYYVYGTGSIDVPLVVFFDSEQNVIDYSLGENDDLSYVEAYDVVAPTGATTMVVNNSADFDDVLVYELPFKANAPYDYRQVELSGKSVSRRIMDEEGAFQTSFILTNSDGTEKVIECTKYSCAEFSVSSDCVYFITGNCNSGMPLYVLKNSEGEILETYNDRDGKPSYSTSYDPEQNIYVKNLEIKIPEEATKLYVNVKNSYKREVYAVPFESDLPLEYRYIKIPKAEINKNMYLNTSNKMISDDGYEVYEYDVKEGYQYIVTGTATTKMPLLTIVDEDGNKLLSVGYNATQSEYCEDYPIIVPSGGVKMYVNRDKENEASFIRGIGKPLKIFLITPPYMLSSERQYSKIPNYADAVVNIGKLYGIPVCNINAESSINIFNADIYKGFGNDGVHLNSAAHKQWANVIIKKLLDLEPIG